MLKRGYSHRKKIVDEIAKQLKIVCYDDWYSVSREQVYKRAPFMRGNLIPVLKECYPQHSWDAAKFKNVPRGFWNSKTHQLQKLEEVGKEFNIKAPEDWINVTNRKQLYNKIPFVTNIYGSLENALKTLYPHHSWENWKVSTEQLTAKQKQKLENIASQLNIKNLDEWYTVSRHKVYKLMPSIHYHYGNLFNALKHFYPEHVWSKQRFKTAPHGFWNDMDNQRAKMEEIAKELNIKSLDDWYKAPREIVYSKASFSKRNLYETLKRLYPQHNWNIFKFERYPQGYFRAQTKDGVHDHLLALQNALSTMPEEKKLFQKIARNLHPKLKHVLHSRKFAASEREAQLQTVLSSVAPIEVNATIHGYSVDVYIPQWAVAIEYQGQQHFKQLNTGNYSQQRERDTMKQLVLEQLGIKLIQIPYWWNSSWNQLISSIQSVSKQNNEQQVL